MASRLALISASVLITAGAVAAAAAAGAGAAAAVTAAVQVTAAVPAHQICQTDRAQLCANRAGGGTVAGTPVISYYEGNANNTFRLLWLSGTCGDGHVHAASFCPNFGPGTGAVDGAIVVAIQDTRTGLCLAAGHVLHDCPTSDGFDFNKGKFAMVFAADVCSALSSCGVTSFMNAYWSQNHNQERWLWIPTTVAQGLDSGHSTISDYAMLNS
jgi:hypothetical protein